MAKYFIRVAQELDFEIVSKHLIVVGELTGDCFVCREIGIDYTKEKYCPQCKTDFRFMTLRNAMSGAQMARLCSRRPDLTYVEYSDIKDISDRNKAKNFFKS